MDKFKTAVTIIAAEEGYRAKVYHCTLGYPTIGVGLKVGHHGQPLGDFKGFPSMPRDVAELWCRIHAEDVEASFKKYPLILAAAEKCNDVQKAVLISMGYQLGVYGLSRFKRMLGHCISQAFEKAAEEMLDSLLADQAPKRTERQARMLTTGKLLEYYGGSL